MMLGNTLHDCLCFPCLSMVPFHIFGPRLGKLGDKLHLQMSGQYPPPPGGIIFRADSGNIRQAKAEEATVVDMALRAEFRPALRWVLAGLQFSIAR
jgi:hypothetical protein